MQEKVEIVTNHILHFWTILDKNTQNGYCDIGGDLFRSYKVINCRLELFEISVAYLKK